RQFPSILRQPVGRLRQRNPPAPVFDRWNRRRDRSAVARLDLGAGPGRRPAPRIAAARRRRLPRPERDRRLPGFESALDRDVWARSAALRGLLSCRRLLPASAPRRGPAGDDARRPGLGRYGGYRVSDARASDGDEVGGLADDDDVSYHGIEAGAGGRMEFMREGAWRLGADLAYELATRVYDSNLPTDRYHFGRNDLLNAVELGIRVGNRPHWSLRGFYRLEDNRAHLGTSAPPTSDSGSYRVNQAGLSIEWNADVWHRAASEGEE